MLIDCQFELKFNSRFCSRGTAPKRFISQSLNGHTYDSSSSVLRFLSLRLGSFFTQHDVPAPLVHYMRTLSTKTALFLESNLIPLKPAPSDKLSRGYIFGGKEKFISRKPSIISLHRFVPRRKFLVSYWWWIHQIPNSTYFGVMVVRGGFCGILWQLWTRWERSCRNFARVYHPPPSTSLNNNADRKAKFPREAHRSLSWKHNVENGRCLFEWLLSQVGVLSYPAQYWLARDE